MRAWDAVIVGWVATLAACSGAPRTEEMVRDALTQANVGTVAVDAEGAMLRLSGTVDTLADRSRAEELASAIAGRDAQVRNEIVVTGLGPLGGAAAGVERSGDTAR